MKDHIKWFIEEFLHEVYVDQETIELWKLKHNMKGKDMDNEKIKVPHRNGEQMTLFELIN
ncbi:TPA: hypothetical protein PBT65_001727 [Staphylococcus aureus]|nr:hypothetical protein [Staphylococcus aureus]